jgi:hypothetical protein
LRDLDGKENAAETEDDRVGNCGNPDRCVTEEEQRLDELDKLEWSRIDALEVEVLLLECGCIVANDVTHVKSLGAKEEVGDKLHTVGLLFVSFVL